MSTRKIISVHGPTAQWAVCDDGTVWFWQFTGISGRWQPWDRPPIPQPEAVVREPLPPLGGSALIPEVYQGSGPAPPAAKEAGAPKPTSGAPKQSGGRR